MTTPGFEFLQYEKREQIARITVSRPKVLNALSAATMRELEQAFLLVRDDDDVRVAILTGAGDKSFIAGADIPEFLPLSPDEALALARRGQAVTSLIENCGKPVIAAVNGFALGGGCELALACTLRLASENARFGQPEVKLGIICGYGGSVRLPRLVGKGRAMQMILTGEMITASEALRIGLVNEVLPQPNLLPRAEAIARQIIANSPHAVRYSLDSVNQGLEMPPAAAMEHEASLFGMVFATEDHDEGVRAFVEKRKAEFKGR